MNRTAKVNVMLCFYAIVPLQKEMKILSYRDALLWCYVTTLTDLNENCCYLTVIISL